MTSTVSGESVRERSATSNGPVHADASPRPIPPQRSSPGVASAAVVPTQALGSAADQSLVDQRELSTWLRSWGLHAEVMLALAAGASTAFTFGRTPYVSLAALFAWMFANFRHGRAATTPVARELGSVAQSTLLPLTAVAAAVGFVGLDSATLPQAFGTLAAAAVVSAVWRAVRWRLQAPVRAIVVGDRSGVATARTRWARERHLQLVGAVLVEPGLDESAAPKDIIGLPTVLGLESAEGLVESLRSDLVLVVGSSAVTSESLRELTWRLESRSCAVGVTGLVDSVAPHRITPGRLGRSVVLDVRPPRPSTVQRGMKIVFDRVAGMVGLVLAAPVLLAIGLAIRLDSKGPAIFVQTRVGQGGRTFRLYKFRTMVVGADEMKSELSHRNEVDSVLFKMRHDPRVTRFGRMLRRASLDELPQLVNVVRGEMSLVGPRPCLPTELDDMGHVERRRHAVKPGMTGLWQVSGRSDLSYDESAALDTYYADNWSLAGDAAICLRTVKAVASGKGAY